LGKDDFITISMIQLERNSLGNKSIYLDTKLLIDKLLLERISLRGIVRSTGVSLAWLQNYVNNKFSRISQQINVSEKSKGKLI